MSGRGRDLGVDAVRGLALLSMYVAHTTSRADPGAVPLVANLLTAALFATLVGAGAGLTRARPGLRAAVAGPLIRGAALVVLGLLLNRAGSSIIVILVHLGLLTWLVAVLSRCATRWVAAIGLVVLSTSPLLLDSLSATDDRLTMTGPHWQSLLLDLAATGDTYRLSSLLGWAAVGMVLARTVVVLPGWTRQLAVGITALVAATTLLLLLRPVPYSGSYAELVVDGLLAGGTLSAGVGLVRLAGDREVGWLADLGRMALTLYALQVLGIAALERWLRPGEPPYGVEVLATLVGGSLVLALVWQAVPALRRWGRGPLEGGVERAVALVGGGRATSAQLRGRHERDLR